MLPEISTEISDINSGNNSKIQIFFFRKSSKSAFSRGRFRKEGGAPGQKFFLNEFGLISRKKFFTSTNLWGASPALQKSILTHQHQLLKKNHDIGAPKVHFYEALNSCISANILQNFTKPHFRTFGTQGVPIVLPEFSVEISDRNSGNTFKIQIFIFKKQSISSFSKIQFLIDWGAPGQKFLSGRIPIDHIKGIIIAT